ncbi:MAG: hypothetical protein EOM26_12965 [Alphaproteobacteria bacterium]|nr:hypothetical protein [Alphaproteobacteria bacterium]
MTRFVEPFSPALAALCLFASPVAHAADWSAAFDPPSSPTAAMRIDLPETLDIMTLTTLGVELDGIDVTALLSLDGNDFIYRPLSPLESGLHTVRLVTLGEEPEEVGSWTFTLETTGNAGTAAEPGEAQISRAESWLRSARFEADTLTEASQRVIDKNLGTSAPDHSIVSGGGEVALEAGEGNWHIRAQSDYLLQTEKGLSATRNTWDIAEYDITAEYGGAFATGGVRLGHHDIGADSFIISNFYRRGASARLATSNDFIDGRIFAFNPEGLTGAREFTGIDENRDRVEGFMAAIKPVGNDPDDLTVTGLFIDGRGTDQGVGIAGADVASEGDGWAVIIEQGFGEGRVKLRGEYARARFDRDGLSGLAAEDDSRACSVAVEAHPFENLVLYDRAVDLVIGAGYERVGTYFESLANPGLAADREAATAYSSLYMGALSAGLSLAHETNNTENLAAVPTDRLRSLNAYASYAFDRQEGRLAWMGSPYVNFSGFIADLDRMETPAGYSGLNTNSVSQSYSLGGGSHYERWYWSINHTLGDFDDHANVANDTLSNLTGINAGWRVNERLNLHGGVQFALFEDQNAGSENVDWNPLFGGDAVLVKDRLDFYFDYNLNLAGGDSGSPDRHLFNSELEWTIVRPGRKSPGLALALRGSMEDIDGNAGSSIQDETTYQLFTVLHVAAPFAFGR